MGFNCGIVGLPNVGKSTLFNALTATAAAQAENFPFCTIEPNIGRVSVPDSRMQEITRIAKPKKIVPAQLEFVDIAGLVKGASKGEGLGNQFLANIRETDAIIHVLRCFDDPDITHVDGSIDPIRDADTIATELMLADLESVDKQLSSLAKKLKSSDKEIKAKHEFMQKVKSALEEGKPASKIEIGSDEEATFLKTMGLVSSKPVLYVCNVSEDDAATGNEWSKQVEKMAENQGFGSVTICAAIEAEIAALEDEDEKKEFLQTMGLEEAGLNKIIRKGYDLLGLHTFFTAGEKEVHAWTIRKGAKAPQAAGTIHSDFEKGFIRAEVISYDDYIACGGESGAREAGKMRSEGKDYIVQDGDIILFRFNV